VFVGFRNKIIQEEAADQRDREKQMRKPGG
jgi:hypothetical protein